MNYEVMMEDVLGLAEQLGIQKFAFLGVYVYSSNFSL